MNEEFYIGYLPTAPAGVAAHTRRTVMIVLVVALIGAGLSALAFRLLPIVTFEFGNTRAFEGWIVEVPYPLLVTERPGDVGAEPAYSRYTLVGFGKVGVGAEVLGLDGKRVALEGALVYRDGHTMIELVSGSIEEVSPAGGLEPPQALSLGELTVVGEIVDSKCFLGVMNPGNLKPHRACAARCISGGIPPVFCVRDERGRAAYLLLVSRSGEPVNEHVLDRIAEPLEITGEVVRYGDQLVLRADPASYRRL